MSVAVIDRQNDLWKLEDGEVSFLTPWGWIRFKYELIDELFGPLEAFGGEHAKAFLAAETGRSKLTKWIGW